MQADRFTQIFREEHRQVRDALLELIRAFEARDRQRINATLGRIATLTGPHFRYEEESLYPALVTIFGLEYVERLFGDHDRAIGSAYALIRLAGQDKLTDDDVTAATRLIRGILPHVSDCDGLSIMVECLPDEQVSAIFASRDNALRRNANLVDWAEQIRTRPAVTLP